MFNISRFDFLLSACLAAIGAFLWGGVEACGVSLIVIGVIYFIMAYVMDAFSSIKDVDSTYEDD